MFLGGEVDHCRSKMILKESKLGGAWQWDQDYRHSYQNGCLSPDMASCLIALDPATKENGCLQVLRGPICWAAWRTDDLWGKLGPIQSVPVIGRVGL
jgi:ectoine hydroxylase-related dioxygenase (phytanoyl-CoA dioxygenase family)